MLRQKWVLIVVMMCVPTFGMAQQFNGTGAKYPRRCSVETRFDTLIAVDPITGEERMTIHTTQASSGKMEDGKYARDGYTVRLMDRMTDTQMIQDPVTLEYTMKQRRPILEPVTINGEKIYRYAEVTKHADQRRHRQPLEDYILAKVSKRLRVLTDGSYIIRMQNVVVNKNGEIVYYELGGIVGLKNGERYRGELAVPFTTKVSIDNEVRAIMNSAPSMKPAKIDGRRVYYIADVYLSDFKIVMKNGEPTFLFRQ